VLGWLISQYLRTVATETVDPSSATTGEDDVERLDVLIVGAGISGIGAACHLQEECPGKSYVILEAREAIGGTWDIFRYPGIRSDSDMFTLGFDFEPWEEAEAIADGPSILEYVNRTARKHGVDRKVRFGHRVVGAEWSSESATWRIRAERRDTGAMVEFEAGFLLGCSGYFDYDEPHRAELTGIEKFEGRVVHPQFWPEDLDYSGKRVVVIGSGATAVTLVPAMAERAEHVTMLQRSPTYMVSMPARDPLADLLQRRLSPKRAYAVLRWKNVLLQQISFSLFRRFPKAARRLLTKNVADHLPQGYPIDPDFNPRYDVWDQRVCLIPDADLFAAMKGGDASIATGTIETFTETGVRLTSGQELEADVIVTATGLKLKLLGGIELVVDGEPVDFSETVGYKGIMFTGVPNMAMFFGYTNASWTLKVDLTGHWVCRLLNHMEREGFDKAVAVWPEEELPDIPFVDLMSGYVLRHLHEFPRQGPEVPWKLHQNFARDIVLLRRRPVIDEGLELSSAPSPRESPEAIPA